MPAIDTILTNVTNAGGAPIGLTAATAAIGDSLTIRNYPLTSPARLEAVSAQMSGTRQARITSPMFHDNVTGMTFSFSEQPSHFLLPREIGQPLTPGDTLTVALSAAATSSSSAVLFNYYTELPGADARLYNWGDISGLIDNIKPIQIAVTTNATIGQWQDTVITTTENQLHARHDYALLGYSTDVALCAVGIKGQETGNLRVCGPGPTSTLDTTDYFVAMAEMHGTPHIPVFNADNRLSIYVSTAANTASVAANVTFILAELTQTLS